MAPRPCAKERIRRRLPPRHSWTTAYPTNSSGAVVIPLLSSVFTVVIFKRRSALAFLVNRLDIAADENDTHVLCFFRHAFISSRLFVFSETPPFHPACSLSTSSSRPYFTASRHVNDAYTISVVRTRTVTPLEFFWNIYSLMKSIVTTFLSLPGISMVLSSLGADQIMNAPGMEAAVMLFENFMSMILLVGSKPG